VKRGRVVDSIVNHCDAAARAGADDHVAEEPERALRADQQPAQVEAADVLHRRAPGLHDLAASDT
jgi:hypothetical protein